ncbi:MAG: uroporphyrinogen decarboxylase [Coxiella sp. RIFCSPHIGHO2_12_FULL_44_14]|nr:MAG: uroporphyrinogen decarboxylase [Coxiella sp. RIFCSPHIGHO2_12_FULL_44_14]
MPTKKNNRIIKALLRQPVDTTPVWMMRQAGRYLPEFRQLRAQVPDFMTFCKTPELACEATLQPLNRFDFDAAIIFSDILTVVDALGLNLEFVPAAGPVVHNPVRSFSALQTLSIERALEKLQYVDEAIRLTSRTLQHRVPLIGFAGSPWTVACYMIEGQNEHQFQITRTMLYREPALLHAVLKLLTELTIHYLNAQIAAGAEIIMLFDTWGGLLSSSTYPEFSLYYMKAIGEGIQRTHHAEKIPLIFFTKNAGLWLKSIANAGCDAVGIDWTVDIAKARRMIGATVALQGGLDPMALYGTPQSVRLAVKKILQDFGDSSGHVFNLGHGVDKETPIENVSAMVAAVREFGKKNESVLT